MKEKWSKENHPAYQAGYRKPEADAPAVEEPQAPTTYAVNDTVSARWKSGDGAFYTAKITSITGSASKPVYIVTFKNYASTETLSAKDIKPLPIDSRKRKADGAPGMSATPAPPPNPNVISAAANVDPALASQARREPSKVSDGPIRPAKVPRKVKANKELEAGKSKWQEFATKGKLGKAAKKESMFRTPDGVPNSPRAIGSFYTDGIEVAFCEDQVVDTERWRQELMSRRDLPTEELLNTFSERLDNESGSLAPKDDLTMVVSGSEAAQ